MKDGVDYISVIKQTEQKVPDVVFTYRPKYRSVSYLSAMLNSVVSSGAFSNHIQSVDYLSGGVSGITTTDSASTRMSIATDAEVLVYSGPAASVRQIEKYCRVLTFRQSR